MRDSCVRYRAPSTMRLPLLMAALLVFGLGACGESPAPTAPPPSPSAPAKAPVAPPAHPPSAPVSEPAPAPAPAAPAAEGAPAASAPVEVGIHYQLLGTPQPTEGGKKVEVIEFFWYACPHCSSLQAPLQEWLKRKPADVAFRRVPAVLDNSWLQLARTYYAIEAMGLVDKLHHDLFVAIHQQKAFDPRYLVRDPKPLFDWVASRGVDRQKFVDTYNSFAVNSRTQRAADLTRNYDVPHTPVLVVDGRYLTSPSMKGNGNPNGSTNYEKFFQSLDQVIELARTKSRAAK